jgi:hypothetical protein
METSATVEQVWRLWSDPSSWGDWNPDVRELKLNGPFQAGTTGTMYQKSGRVHRITLTNVQPSRSFQLETSPVPLTIFVFTCEVRGDGVSRTVISQSVGMRGPLGPVMGPMSGERVAQSFEPLLRGLARKAESGAG